MGSSFAALWPSSCCHDWPGVITADCSWLASGSVITVWHSPLSSLLATNPHSRLAITSWWSHPAPSSLSVPQMFSLQIWIPASDGAGEGEGSVVTSPVSQEAGHLPPGQGLVTRHWISWHPPLLISFPDRNKKIILDPDLCSALVSSEVRGQIVTFQINESRADPLLGKYSHLLTLSPHPSALRMFCHLFHRPSLLSTLCQHQKSFQRPRNPVRALRTNAALPFHPLRTLLWSLNLKFKCGWY